MKKLFFLPFLILVTLEFSSCRKNRHDLEQGTYSGNYVLEQGNSGKTGSVTLEIGYRKYESYASISDAPAVKTGSGVFRTDNDLVHFESKKELPTDIDMNLLLNGTFSYLVDGDNLVLMANRGDAGVLKYNLVKTK